MTPRSEDVLRGLGAIGPESDPTAASDALEALFTEIGSEDIGELLIGAVERGWLSEAQARWLVGVAMWSGTTEGSQLHATLERWLDEAPDSLRVGLALESGVFHFREHTQMTHVLTRVMQHYPQYTARCRQLIEQRRQQGV